MDVQLKELIEKIKTEGVGEADERAKEIISGAEKEASEIISNAKKEAEEIISNARKEVTQFENASKEAIKQAGRDLILNVKSALTELFDSVIKREARTAFTDDVLKEVIPAILSGWNKEKTSDLEVLLSKEDCTKLEDAILSKLADELKSGITIRPHATVNSGFRIAEKDGDSYYDFTDEGIADNLIQHMNPILAEIIKESASGE